MTKAESTKYHGNPCSICGETLRYASGNCVKCARARRLRRYAKNKDAEREYMREYASRNKDAQRLKSRRWYENNHQLTCDRSHQWRQDHPIEAKENLRRWKAENHDMVLAACRRRRVLKKNGKSEPYDFRSICDQYGNICLCCGASDVKLTVDHVVPISRGGDDVAANIQPLCGYCNNSKGVKSTDYRFGLVGKSR